MGIRGRSGFERLLIGSTALGVVTYAHCPATASACNDLAKQGIIPDFIRNKTLVDLQTNINPRVS
jgi:Universal stress protein family